MPSVRSHVAIPFDVQCILLQYLPTPSLQRFARMHRELYRHFKGIEHHLFSVPAIISPFFEDVRGFRELQWITGLLITGSQALQLLKRVHYAQSDMDLCVSQYFAVSVIQWVTAHGYELLDLHKPNDQLDAVFSDSDLRRVASNHAYNLRYGQLVFRFVGRDSPNRVDLIVSSESALSSVLDFHSTAVMNFIAVDYAISLFPHATFVQDLSLVMRSDDERRTQKCVDKYEQRGFTAVYSSKASFAFAPGFRWICDPSSDDGSQSVHATRRTTAIRGRACWVLKLPEVTPPVAEVVQIRKDSGWRAGGGLRYWRRHGWKMVERDDGYNISLAFVNFGYVQYCAPPEFQKFVSDRVGVYTRRGITCFYDYDQWRREFMLRNV